MENNMGVGYLPAHLLEESFTMVSSENVLANESTFRISPIIPQPLDYVWHAYATLYLLGVHVVVDKRKGISQGTFPHQRYRKILELCRALAVYVLWCAKRFSPVMPERN